MRREEILTAAIKVFGKKGFAATCVGDVADAAKIAKGTVYLYFESKEEIYATAIAAGDRAAAGVFGGADAGGDGGAGAAGGGDFGADGVLARAAEFVSAAADGGAGAAA